MTDTPDARRKPSLSTCTISWNQKEDIIRFLTAMDKARAECPYPIETVLVDNGSRDGTPEMVAERFPWVKLRRNDRNTGFAAGCNHGIEIATGDYLMLLNPDSEPNAAAFTGMIEYLEAHPDVGGVGCMLLHEDGLPQLSAFRLVSPWSYWVFHSMAYPLLEKIRKLLYKFKLIRLRRPFECGWLQGSCIMVPRKVCEAAGPLEPSYFIYLEDTDWCYRIRKAGYKIVHLPQFAFIHKQKGSVGRKPEFFFRRVYRSMVHFGNRQLDERERRGLFRAMLLDMRLRQPVYRVIGWLRPSRREALRARIESCRRLVEIIRAANPDLYDDPPPR